ncbi:Brix domain-containing protein [Lineolata rhizophorae]|uniref:Brix domain-containing protein n=1 Tax=Lineolata rhizophorae TaxID=578093 RepID=A0A6A6P1D2_9PEZI|nr:Brix domain-containing protein [Lineolata rhizophorae]
MAHGRKKKRTHLGAKNTPTGSAAVARSKAGGRKPQSMVIRMGGAKQVGPSVSELAKDIRQVMEPGTASRLQERKANRLRDYTTMAGPLGVTHLLLFSRSKSGNTNMRLAVTPRGPTLSFRVENYSLCKDVQRAQKHPRTGTHDFQTAPLLVMNNFTTPAANGSSTGTSSTPQIPKHLESLTTTVFQSLFPPISPQTTAPHSMKRVLLLNREPSASTISTGPDGAATSHPTYVLTLRHYAITTRSTALPSKLRRFAPTTKLPKHSATGAPASASASSSRATRRAALPNLGRYNDAADYLLGGESSGSEGGGGFTSESEVETDAEVEVLSGWRKPKSRAERARGEGGDKGEGEGEGEKPKRKVGAGGVEKRAVKLVELGPRMRLRLVKVEEGVCEGKVLWHEYVRKSGKEVREQEAVWEKRRKEKEERRKVQKENVERKRREREEKVRRKEEKRGKGEKVEESGESEEEDEDMLDEDLWSDESEGEGSEEVGEDVEMGEGSVDEDMEGAEDTEDGD